MMDPVEYGANVRRRRKALQPPVSQERLAALVRLSGRTIQNVENGRGCNSGTRVLIELALERARSLEEAS